MRSRPFASCQTTCERGAITAARSDDRLLLTVRDNGPGLSAEQRQKIFEPFYTTKTKGTGLGMAIVKRIMDAHDGTRTSCKSLESWMMRKYPVRFGGGPMETYLPNGGQRASGLPYHVARVDDRAENEGENGETKMVTGERVIHGLRFSAPFAA